MSLLGRLVRRNLLYKLIALGTAILLYVIADAQQNPRTVQNIYVQPEVRGLSADMVVSDRPDSFRVTVSGPTALVEALATRGIGATIDATGRKPGTARLPVQYELPPDLKDRVTINGPGVAGFTLARKIRQEYAVDVIYPNQPPPNYVFRDPIVTPRRITVAGLEADVGRVRRVVANLETSRVTGTIEEEVDLVAQDMAERVVDNVEIEPARVRVRLALKPVPATRTLLLSPVFRGEVAPGFRVVSYTFEPQAVTVAGSPDQLETLTSLEVPINQEGLRENTTRTVTLRPPLGLRILDSPKVTVTIQVQSGEAPPDAPASTNPGPEAAP